MRAMSLAAALAVVITIACSPARASGPPVSPDHAGKLQFRGARPGPWTLQRDGHWIVGSVLVAQSYFINADSSDRVIVTGVDGARVQLESPGEWTGAGVLMDSTYWGVFVYRGHAREARNRGARGTHLGSVDASGRVRIRGTFTNRKWPEFSSTWTPVNPMPASRAYLDELLRLHELPINELYEHPVWPRERGRIQDPR